ncbi:MAG TPA: hypothetical protein VJZ26_14935 [Blastocatellia bacterium]|nr:hypothetical protein [Blastocatellia bacterium]
MRKLLMLLMILLLALASSAVASQEIAGQGKNKECRQCRKQFKADKRLCKALKDDKPARRACKENARARLEQCVAEHCPTPPGN